METKKPQQKLRNRLFVGGLQALVTESSLIEYFSTFGEIIKAQVMRDPKRHISKGYGFITCKKISTARKIMKYEGHEINGRKIDVGKAAAKWETDTVKNELRQKKIFITGIGLEVSDRKFPSPFYKFVYKYIYLHWNNMKFSWDYILTN